jgi:beta-N-acetylhexosaminidase
MTTLAGGLTGCFGADSDDENSNPNVIGNVVTTTVAASPPAPEQKTKDAQPSLAQLVGQKFVVAYRQTTVPPASLLARIKRGEIGGVILFNDNVPQSGAPGIRGIVTRLQRAAREGGNPRLLIATDQEGGDVKRMPGPPARSPRELGAAGAGVAREAGVATGRSLRAMGVGIDLAPVADVPADPASFLGTRAFGTSERPNIRAAVAFARGLQRAGVAATAKHYPGLGSSGNRNTDTAEVTLDTPRAALDRERAAFQHQVDGGTRLVMMSNATYLAYDRNRPAVASRKIIGRLRRGGFHGVVISDELRVPGLRRFGSDAAAIATRAGVDVLLFASATGTGAAEYRALLAAVKAGRVRRSLVEQQVRRIASLKRWIASRASR